MLNFGSGWWHSNKYINDFVYQDIEEVDFHILRLALLEFVIAVTFSCYLLFLVSKES